MGSRPPLRGVFRGNPRRVSERVSRAFRPRGPKSVRNSLGRVSGVSKNCFETPETLPRLLRKLFGPRGRKAPEDVLFQRLFGDSGNSRRARETPLRGGRDPNKKSPIVSKKFLNTTVSKKLGCKQEASNCKQKSRISVKYVQKFSLPGARYVLSTFSDIVLTCCHGSQSLGYPTIFCPLQL